jgi:dihydrofolate reductase
VIASIIVAMDKAGGIGKGGGLPWHLSADLKNFKSLTMGHTLIVGRKTYESIGRALPGRKMIVITRNKHYSAEGCQVVASLKEALAMAERDNESEAFIGGGGQIFTQVLPSVERIYLTRVHATLDCDTCFPKLDWSEWQEGEQTFHPADARNDYAFTYSIFKKVSS